MYAKLQPQDFGGQQLLFTEVLVPAVGGSPGLGRDGDTVLSVRYRETPPAELPGVSTSDSSQESRETFGFCISFAPALCCTLLFLPAFLPALRWSAWSSILFSPTPSIRTTYILYLPPLLISVPSPRKPYAFDPSPERYPLRPITTASAAEAAANTSIKSPNVAKIRPRLLQRRRQAPLHHVFHHPYGGCHPIQGKRSGTAPRCLHRLFLSCKGCGRADLTAYLSAHCRPRPRYPRDLQRLPQTCPPQGYG